MVVSTGINIKESEAKLIIAALAHGELNKLRLRGVTPQILSMWGNVLEFVYGYESNYGKVPSVDSVYMSFADFPVFSDDSIDVDFLIDLVIENYRKLKLRIMMSKTAELLEIKTVDEVAGFILSQLPKLEYKGSARATFIDQIADVAITRFMEAKALADAGKIGGLPTGIHCLDEEGISYEAGDFILIMGPPSIGKCASGKTTVIDTTTGKRIKIKDIVVSNTVVSMDEDMKLVPQNSPMLIDNGIADLYRVTTRSGREIELTANHPLLTIHGWKMVSELKTGRGWHGDFGDFIAVPRILPYFGHNVIEDYKLKVLGYVIADGSTRSNAIQFTKRVDNDILRDYIRCIQQFGDRCNQNAKGQVWVLDPKASNIYLWFDAIGIMGLGSREKKLPEFVFELTPRCLGILLAALWDCDGEARPDSEQTGYIAYSSTSEELIKQMAHLLLRFGIWTRRRRRSIGWELDCHHGESICKFYENIGQYMVGYKRRMLETLVMQKQRVLDNGNEMDTCDTFPKAMWNIVSQERSPYCAMQSRHPAGEVGKWLKTRSISRKMVSRYAKRYETALLAKYANSDVLWDPVVSIEYIGKGQVYDLSLMKHHNFVANDIVIHNSWVLIKSCVAAYVVGCRVMFISPEMPMEDVANRAYPILGGQLGYKGLSSDGLSKGYGIDINSYKALLDTLKKRSDFIVVDDVEGGNLTAIRIEGLIKEYNPDFIAADTLMLFRASDGKMGVDWQPMLEVAYDLKFLATRTGKRIMASAGTTAETFDTTTPAKLSDLGLSKNVGYAMDLCISMSNSKIEKHRNLRVAKKRKGKGISKILHMPFDPDVGVIG